MKKPNSPIYLINRVRRGFTLVELLVTIFIMILLGSLVFVMMGSMRARAADSVCLTKLSQLGQAALGASNDSNAYLAATFFDSDNGGAGKTYWWEKVAPHVYTNYDQLPNMKKIDGLFRDSTSSASKGINDSEFRNPKWTEIGWMPWINNENVPSALNKSKPGIHLNILRRPSGQPFLSAADNTGSTGVWNKAQFVKYVATAAARHRGHVLSFYCDGHVEMVRVAGRAADYRNVAPSMPDA